jgi:hypothetical protein
MLRNPREPSRLTLRTRYLGLDETRGIRVPCGCDRFTAASRGQLPHDIRPRSTIRCHDADRWGSMPNGAQRSFGRGRSSVEAGPTPALWRSAQRGGWLGHNALPVPHHDVRCCPYAPPVSPLPRPVGARNAAAVVTPFGHSVSVLVPVVCVCAVLYRRQIPSFAGGDTPGPQ